jgi:NADH-quinone oxidoreductase subunit H
MQNRIGPPWFQPFADFIKLMAKEDIVPEKADKPLFNAVPIIAFGAVATAFLYIPVFTYRSFAPFEGDLIVILYLLTIPTIGLFVIGWSSRNLFAVVGGMRSLTQLFSYEVPLFLALLGPAILAGTWNVSEIAAFQRDNFWMICVQPIGFIVAIIALEGKLERIPFDIPDAETEIVGGPLTEYSGRKLAMIRMIIDMEMVTVAALITALFLGGPNVWVPLEPLPDIGGYPVCAWIIGFIAFLLKTLFIVFLLSLIRVGFARIRIDQMAVFGWKYIAPLALFQLLLVAFAKTGILQWLL